MLGTYTQNNVQHSKVSPFCTANHFAANNKLLRAMLLMGTDRIHGSGSSLWGLWAIFTLSPVSSMSEWIYLELILSKQFVFQSHSIYVHTHAHMHTQINSKRTDGTKCGYCWVFISCACFYALICMFFNSKCFKPEQGLAQGSVFPQSRPSFSWWSALFFVQCWSWSQAPEPLSPQHPQEAPGTRGCCTSPEANTGCSYLIFCALCCTPHSGIPNERPLLMRDHPSCTITFPKTFHFMLPGKWTPGQKPSFLKDYFCLIFSSSDDCKRGIPQFYKFRLPFQ